MIAECEILMDGNYLDVKIAVGTGTLNAKEDEEIFFYVDSEEDLEFLLNENNGEDFHIIQIYNKDYGLSENI